MTLGSPDLGGRGLALCLEIFFVRHFASDFCSFDHRPDFERKCTRDPLLASAIIALCGRYLEDHDAQALFGLSSGPQVTRSRLPDARSHAKASLDQPSGTVPSRFRPATPPCPC